MSNALSSPLNPSFSFKSGGQYKDIDSSSVPFSSHNFVLSTRPSLAGPSTWQTASQPTHTEDTNQPPKTITKAKKRAPEEQESTAQTSERFVVQLAKDHASALYPDVDSPFSDTIDVINRLLPYHVYQQPKGDLQSLISSRKGKEKASENDVRQEISETRFAIECFKRRAALQERFHKVKTRAAKKSVPGDQAFVLAQSVLEADRSESVVMTNELRMVRADLERIEKEKRVTVNTARPPFYTSTPTTAIPSVQQQYYRPYPYAYTQAYGVPPVQASSSSTFPVSPAGALTPSASYTPAQSTGAIPVQLPVASLPALHALGIVPIPVTSLPPNDQPQPPAVLRGSTANGTMLSLEIDVSLLQSAQMSGLAMVLNSLMSRSGAGVPIEYTANPLTETTISNGTPS
ncbi:hypothetical protein BDZ94DRAFT_1215472 [Collybia nuda]|uniref:GLTSCR protein conserved domain-containing protein n=1 Tax=Collybia nuda TaxID=64659 RepID=A0A9P5YAZ9_9AGAR|nr:hypothetical protein BDZ94DRAFT_1215472 [Collybia nuda]